MNAPFLKWTQSAPNSYSSCWCSDQTDLTNSWEGDWDGQKSVTWSMARDFTCAEVALAVPENTFMTDDCVDVTFEDGVCLRELNLGGARRSFSGS